MESNLTLKMYYSNMQIKYIRELAVASDLSRLKLKKYIKNIAYVIHC